MNHTLLDIARRAGVSTSTVSRVLSNSSHTVAERTRQRVLRAAEELKFTPNAFARGLSKGEFRFIGLVVPDVRDPYFVEIARGTEDLASQRGYLVVLCNTDRDPAKEQRYVEELSALRAGVILTGGGVDRESHLKDLASHPAPVVAIGRHQLPCSALLIDNAQGTMDVVAHLVELGHRRIAHIGGPLSSPSGVDRLAGFRHAMEAHGLPIDESLIVESDYTMEGGSTGLGQLLAQGSAPATALFAGNDQMALGAMREARRRGLRIPEDLAVVGFNGIAAAAESDPPLTTLSLSLRHMGQIAADLLLQQRENGRRDHVSVPIRGELIVRGSTVPGADTPVSMPGMTSRR